MTDQQLPQTSCIHLVIFPVSSRSPMRYSQRSREQNALWFWFWSHLSPEELSHADEDAPQPLVDGQSRAGERLPSELNDDDLRRRRSSRLVLAELPSFIRISLCLFKVLTGKSTAPLLSRNHQTHVSEFYTSKFCGLIRRWRQPTTLNIC